MSALLMVAAATAAALSFVAAYVYLRPCRREENYKVRCACCKQKLRYSATRAGRPGTCPRCRATNVLPDNPELLRSGAVFVGKRIAV